MKRITSEWLKSAKSDLDTVEEILSNDQTDSCSGLSFSAVH